MKDTQILEIQLTCQLMHHIMLVYMKTWHLEDKYSSWHSYAVF